MNVVTMKKDRESVEKHLAGRRNIITFGAGGWSYDIKKVVNSYGFDIDYAAVDDAYFDGNTFMDRYGGSTKTAAMSWMETSYDPAQDAIIWAVGNPERLRGYRDSEEGPGDVLLLWDTYDFWDDRCYALHNKSRFEESSRLLRDELSMKTFWAYCRAQEGSIEDDIEYGSGGRTYFNDLTDIEKDGCFVDCGAFDGEDSIEYLNFTGKPHKVFAFEPDKENYRVLLKNAEPYEDFVCINKGCHSSERILRFSAEADMTSCFDESGGGICGSDND